GPVEWTEHIERIAGGFVCPATDIIHGFRIGKGGSFHFLIRYLQSKIRRMSDQCRAEAAGSDLIEYLCPAHYVCIPYDSRSSTISEGPFRALRWLCPNHGCAA